MSIKGAVPPTLIRSCYFKPSLSMCLKAPKPPRFIRMELAGLCGTMS